VQKFSKASVAVTVAVTVALAANLLA